MFKLVVSPKSYWNEETEEFVTIKGAKLLLEHSLLSISKWEATWKKPFLDDNDKTRAQLLDYVRCMTITANVDPNVYVGISDKELSKVTRYIRDSQTATWFREDPNTPKKSSKKVTSELIYYWMVQHGIPFSCEKWHLNRLLTLIRICNANQELDNIE